MPSVTSAAAPTSSLGNQTGGFCEEAIGCLELTSPAPLNWLCGPLGCDGLEAHYVLVMLVEIVTDCDCDCVWSCVWVCVCVVGVVVGLCVGNFPWSCDCDCVWDC